jgi:hypothetical protein
MGVTVRFHVDENDEPYEVADVSAPTTGERIRLDGHRYDVASVEVSYSSGETLSTEAAVVDVQLRSVVGEVS